MLLTATEDGPAFDDPCPLACLSIGETGSLRWADASVVVPLPPTRTQRHTHAKLWLCSFGSVVNRGHHAATVPLCPVTTHAKQARGRTEARSVSFGVGVAAFASPNTAMPALLTPT